MISYWAIQPGKEFITKGVGIRYRVEAVKGRKATIRRLTPVNDKGHVVKGIATLDRGKIRESIKEFV